jgi:hypothetical protein
MFEELQQHTGSRGVGGFLPAIKQIANVAALPGIVGVGGSSPLAPQTPPCSFPANLIAIASPLGTSFRCECARLYLLPPLWLCRVLTKLVGGPLSLQQSIGLPDVHSGYGFAIGNMAAFDMADPDAVVSPGT